MPTCLEHKHLLSGEVHTYACELVHFEPGFGILKYVIDREYPIAGHKLAPGDVTCALYWEDRPYTLYIWNLADGSVLHYFNIADRVSLSPAEFSWRDLVIDILVDASDAPLILDRDELPQDLDKDLLHSILGSQDHILAHWRTIIDEADTLIRQHG